MKTRNKTIRRFSGIAVLLVLSLVATNLNAQNSFNNFTLASLGNSIVKNSKHFTLHTETAKNFNYKELDKEPIENWMINPADWNKENAFNLTEEESFEESEMILEDWMIKANWEDKTLMEKELQMEEWMSKPASWNAVN